MKLVVTGASGGVGTLLRPALVEHAIRVVDRRPAAGWGETLLADLGDPDVAAAAVAGADAVLHLAGNPRPDAAWDQLLPANIATTAAVLDAAAAAHVSRVVVASSVHALGGYLQRAVREPIDPQSAPLPCCRYGASKAFAEAAAAATAYGSSTSVVCLRLGGCRPVPPNAGYARTWIGTDDLRSLVLAALTADLRYGVFAGISANATSPFGPGTVARDLGWVPRQNSATYGELPEGTSGVLCPPG
ncbi:NAD-dependent epimerase/dehydratase family protein [Kribbella sp. NBC_00889]|uniref:NAD-dependent epimerase/dehydratase family protein n=1 Tax=Kribbella sp. NBC_00889 TaxID=2975974 RepID=UPI00386D1015|nr:NAD-dependent epimerase/dehydratase family protein [Kribbella sp. NBC_00889]